MHRILAETIFALSRVLRALDFQRGKDRFLIPLLSRFSYLKPHFQGRSFRCSKLGVRWSASSFPDIMTRTMLVRGTYQDDVICALSSLVREDDVVFDVGAHHGLMSIIASRLVGASGKLIAFEPNPASRAVLEEHLKLNDVTNVVIEPVGLTDREGSAPFYAHPGEYSWNSTLIGDFADEKSRSNVLSITTTTLDHYCAKSGLRPSVIKIDTEGSDFLILKGGAQVLRDIRPHLILELNPIAAASAGTTIGELVDFLTELGYQLFALRRSMFGHYSFDHKKPLATDSLKGHDWLHNVVCLSQHGSSAR